MLVGMFQLTEKQRVCVCVCELHFFLHKCMARISGTLGTTLRKACMLASTLG